MAGLILASARPTFPASQDPFLQACAQNLRSLKILPNTQLRSTTLCFRKEMTYAGVNFTFEAERLLLCYLLEYGSCVAASEADRQETRHSLNEKVMEGTTLLRTDIYTESKTYEL